MGHAVVGKVSNGGEREGEVGAESLEPRAEEGLVDCGHSMQRGNVLVKVPAHSVAEPNGQIALSGGEPPADVVRPGRAEG